MKDRSAKWLLILLGSFSWCLTMFKSGFPGKYGLGFWGANGHDGIWHIALSSTLAKSSFSMPVFSGEFIKNYHLGFDFLMAIIHNLSGISFLDIYFRVIPLLLSVLLGLITYKFVFEWSGSSKSALWSLFFVYFGGGFAFLLGKGESTFWSQQAISTLINPPFALSLLLIILGMILVRKAYLRPSLVNLVLPVLVFGTLIEVKAYAGLLSLVALFAAGGYAYIKDKNKSPLLIALGSMLLSLILLKIANFESSGVFIWQPFWFLESMLGLSDRLDWQRFYSAVSTYKSGHIFIKLIPAYIFAFAIFLIGNMGTRVTSLLYLLKNLKKFSWEQIFIYTILFAGIAIPTLFVQSGTPWNSIQFFYYSLFFSAILAGISMQHIKPKFLSVLIVLLTIPTTYRELKVVYLPQRPPAVLSSAELDALTFLKNQPEGIVLTYPFSEIESKEAEKYPPRPLYLYTSTAYVSAFSEKTTYLEDTINLNITGFDWVNRKNKLMSWYTENNQDKARKFLTENNIKYIYWVKPQRALLGEGNLGLSNIFENKTVVVYKVD